MDEFKDHYDDVFKVVDNFDGTFAWYRVGPNGIIITGQTGYKSAEEALEAGKEHEPDLAQGRIDAKEALEGGPNNG